MLEAPSILIIVSFLIGLSGVFGKTRREKRKGFQAVTITGYFVIICLIASLFFGLKARNDARIAHEKQMQAKEDEKTELKNQFNALEASYKSEISLLKEQLSAAMDNSNALVISGLKVRKGLWVDIKPNDKHKKLINGFTGNKITTYKNILSFLDALLPPEYRNMPMRFNACMGNLCIVGDLPNGTRNGNVELICLDELGNTTQSRRAIPYFITKDAWIEIGNYYLDEFLEVSPFFRRSNCGLHIELDKHLTDDDMAKLKEYLRYNVDGLRMRTSKDSGNLFEIRAELELKFLRSKMPSPESPGSSPTTEIIFKPVDTYPRFHKIN